jgi:tetratricopeptide (TPR) repeat protein
MGRLLFPLLIPFLALQAGEDVTVSASLNRQTARVGETVLLTVTLRAQGLHSPEIETPPLEGFEVLSSTDRSTFEYTLRALQEGEIVIPPIRVTVDDALYETEALRLAVEGEETTPDLPSSLRPRPEEEVAVRLWVDPETAYVGQQVTLTVGAFFDPMVRSRLQRQPEYRAPDVQGFWTADLPGSMKPERRVLDGREYFVQIYRRALFPLSPGALRIPPASVIYEVRRGLIYAPETFQVESSAATIQVRPLPMAGIPIEFAGAVGRYETEIWFEDRADLQGGLAVRAGQAVKLVLEVKGSGNLSSLARPVLPEIPGIRVYDGGEEGEVQLQGSEFAGHKRFAWVLVPERAGEYVVPELSLPYFDPLEAAYSVSRTEPLTLMVGSAAAGTVAAGGVGGTAIRYVKVNSGRQPLNLASQREYWLLQLAPILVLLGALALGRLQRREPAAVRQRPQRRQQVLRHLRPQAESGDAAFFGRLRSAVLNWLEARLHQPGLSTRGVVHVQHALEDSAVPPPVALEMIGLLERCGRLRYAPDPPGSEMALEMLAEADRLLALIDREAISEKSLRSVTRGSDSGRFVILAFVALWPLTATAQIAGSGADRLFQEGVSAYGRGDYGVARELFQAALRERPNDPNLMYNLGNAHYELEERGQAVAYWVRTLRTRPRDRDAHFNLRLVVGEDPVVGSALSPIPLSRDELAVLLAVLWFGGCAALLARRRWRKASLAFAGGVSLFLAVLCAAVLLYPRAEYAIVASSDAALRAGPVRRSEVLTAPTEGTGYQVQEHRNDWLRVSRGGESEGWIERSQVELID